MVGVKSRVICPLLFILALLVLSSTPIIVGRKAQKRLPPDVFKIAGGHNANRPGVGALTSYTASEAADRSNRGPPVIFGSRFRQPYRNWQSYYNPYYYDY